MSLLAYAKEQENDRQRVMNGGQDEGVKEKTVSKRVSEQMNFLLRALCCCFVLEMARSEKQEVCNAEHFDGTCPSDSVIVMESAFYGRMKLGACVRENYGHVGCTNDVLYLVDRWCSGQQSCTIPVPNRALNSANNECARDLALYLEAEYSCVTVQMPEVGLCPSESTPSVHGKDGYFSSHVTSESGCGSVRNPLIVTSFPGQTIDFWLLDFGASGERTGVSCQQTLGFLSERNLRRNVTICRNDERRKHVYKSETNEVQLQLVTFDKNSPRFLIHYVARGCSDLTPPAHAWYKRDGNEAVIGCKANDRIWRLYCNGNTWDGVVGNCSEKAIPSQRRTAGFQFTFSTVILLTSVVCGAVLLIIIVIVSGAVYVKKQRIRHDIKLRSDYGMISQCQYYTLKSGYGMNTMSSANCQLPVDSQPLVHIVDKDAMDTTTSHNLDQPVARGTTSTSGNLI